jgi:hypothetical protein
MDEYDLEYTRDSGSKIHANASRSRIDRPKEHDADDWLLRRTPNMRDRQRAVVSDTLLPPFF